MTLPFPQKWANASTDRRAPTTEENANGFACGAADPNLFDHLEYTSQDAINKIARQIEFAATQIGMEYSPADESILDDVLKTYKDIISENLVLNVPSQLTDPAEFNDPADAMNYLSRFRISNDATVIVNCAAGVYNLGSKVISGHPDGLRIKILGPALPTGMVTEANFSVTGSSGANIATDRITNDAMLRGRFPVVILSTNGAVDAGTGDLTLENLCFIGTGVNEGVKTSGGHVRATNVAAHNYSTGWVVDRGGIIYAPGCTSSGNGGDGWSVTNNGTIVADSSVASGNGNSGFAAIVGGTIVAAVSTAKGNGNPTGAGYFVSLSGIIQARAAVAKNNEGSGFLITNDGFIQARESTSQNNKVYGYEVFNGGRLNAAASTSGSNTSGDYRCSNFGAMTITGYGGTASASPTVNTVGNGNCYIKN